MRPTAARLLILAAAIACGPADAQVFVQAVETNAPDAETKAGFQFETNAKLQDLLTDFRRHADRGLFEKAIEVLDRLDETEAEGLLESDSGLLLPAEEQVWRLQSEMGGELREAFRIFLDAKAAKEFAEAVEAYDGTGGSISGLRAVYQRYFVSRVGDEATNLLGDAAFRDGDFARAARMYQDVLDYHPDSDIPAARLLLKLGVAQSRSGDAEAASRTLRTLRERHASATVRFAGRDVSPVDALEDLLPEAGPGADAAPTADRPAGSLPDVLKPIWRHQYLTDQSLATLRQSEQSYYYKGAVHFVPPVAVAGNRLAFNYYGAVSALDVRTGKLEWVASKPADAIGKMSNNFYGLTTDAYGLSAGGSGDAAVFVSREIPPDRFNYWRVGAEVTFFRAGDGRKLHSTGGSNRGQSEWYHLGKPLVVPGGRWQDHKTYVLAVKTEGATEAFLRVFTGSKPREIRLGRYRGVQMENYQGRSVPNPIIARDPSDEDSLLILLDEGLLLSFSTESEEVSWGLRLPANPATASSNRVYSNQGPTVANTLHPRSSMLIDGATAFVKDGEWSSISAVGVGEHSVLWQRRIDALSQIVGVDGRRLYVLGTELSALDRGDGSLVWSVPLPMQNGGLSCVPLGESVAVFTGRGLYELAREDGSLLKIHREVEPESDGGRAVRVGDRLVTVSERAVTAYPLASYDADAVRAELAAEAAAGDETETEESDDE